MAIKRFNINLNTDKYYTKTQVDEKVNSIDLDGLETQINHQIDIDNLQSQVDGITIPDVSIYETIDNHNKDISSVDDTLINIGGTIENIGVQLNLKETITNHQTDINTLQSNINNKVTAPNGVAGLDMKSFDATSTVFVQALTKRGTSEYITFDQVKAKQDQTSTSLNTTDKTIVGAINENKTAIDNIITGGTEITDITSFATWVSSGSGRYINLNLDPNLIEENATYYLDYLLNCDIKGDGTDTRYIGGTVLGGQKGLTLIGQQYFPSYIRYTPNSSTTKQYTINTLFSYAIRPDLINIFIIPYLNDGFTFPIDSGLNNGCALQDGTKLYLRKETLSTTSVFSNFIKERKL